LQELACRLDAASADFCQRSVLPCVSFGPNRKSTC
jgi:hypothetical protein